MPNSMQPALLTDPFRNSSYEKIQDLGKGTYGSVKLARHKYTGEYVAIKMLERGPEITKYVERELCNHRLLAHDHIIRFLEAFLTDTHLCIVMEYAAGGNLLDCIKHYHATLHCGFTEDDARWFFWQLMVAVDYCHRQNICNRDIKLENTLLNNRSSRPLLKLCDFGFSKNSRDHSAPRSLVGSMHYMAPEVLRAQNQGQYDGKAVDIWSCGVVLYVLLFRRYPFARSGDPNDGPVPLRILSLDYTIPDHIPYSSTSKPAVSDDYKDLLQRMMCGEPEERITMREIFSHPWFLQGCDPRVLTMNNYTRRIPNPHLQTEETLVSLVHQACVSLAG